MSELEGEIAAGGARGAGGAGGFGSSEAERLAELKRRQAAGLLTPEETAELERLEMMAAMAQELARAKAAAAAAERGRQEMSSSLTRAPSPSDHAGRSMAHHRSSCFL